MPLALVPALWPRLAALTVALWGTMLVAACSGMGGGGAGSGAGLAPGLTASMDQPGAQLDQAAAYSILNQYRATRGVAAFSQDAALTAQAQQLARAYAQSGTPPTTPSGVQARYSAGYTNFADTFSGWRGTPADAQALANGQRAGLAVTYDPASSYGTYWVLLVGS